MDKRIDCNYGCPLFQVEVDNCCEKYCSDMADYKEEVRADAIAEISREIRFLYGNEYEKQIRADAIDEYSNELWRIIELATINCKLDLTIDDLHNLEMLIKGLAEDLKEQNNVGSNN